MFIESIELQDYRNYQELHMELDEGTNILYGDNAQERPISWKAFTSAAPQNPTGVSGIGI